jgi:hypothetical protein
MTLEDFEALLITACDEHIAKGGKIITSHFKDDANGYCPLKAACPTPPVKFEGIDNMQMSAFVLGFDGLTMTKAATGGNPFYELGVKLRAKYIEAQ